MATSLPLARGFFNAAAARPSEDQRRQYIEFAESSIRKVFALSDCHRNSWIPVREKKGVAVFRNFGSARGVQAHKSNIAEVGGKGDVQASLDEIARAYAAHDDALFSRLMKKLNGAVMDAAVVTTIVPRSPLAPFRYIGIKWFAVKTPTPLVSHRDYCCLEVQDKIVDAYGNEMYIRILNSIEIKECPSLENSHGLVRAKMLAGYMYRTDRAEPTVVRIHHVARFDPAGYFPSQWAYKTAESQLVSSVVQIKRVVEKQQMNACTFVDKKQWVPNHERQHCAVCSRHFGTFRPRHHCRCCGEVICGKCSIFKSVDVPGTTLKNVRICSICNMGVQKARGANDNDPNQLDDAMSDISTSSVTSSSTIAHNEMNLMDLYLSGPPGTPSAYSTASAQSNLSMRSTTSTRSVITDGRAHRGNSGGGGGTPGTARFFKGGNGSTRGGGYSIFSSSTRGAGATFTSSTTPAGRLGHNGSGGLFNDTNTPRSYLGGGITPHRLPVHGGLPQGFGGTNSAASTPRGTAFSAGDPQEAEEHEHRKSVFKQNPLDLAYLRESVRVARTDTTSTTMTNTNEDGDESMQGDDAEEPAPVTVEEVESTTTTTTLMTDDIVAETETEAVSVPDEAMTTTTTTDDVVLVTETVVDADASLTTAPMDDSVVSAPVSVVDSACDVTTTTMAVTIPATTESQVEEEKATPAPATATADMSADASPASVSTTPRRLRGESGALLLPPAKMARVEDDDVEMEDATSDNQQDTEVQPFPEPEVLTVSELVAETASEEPVAADETNQDAVVADTAATKIDERSNFADDFVVTFNDIFDDAVKPMDVEMEDDDVIRSSANSTSTTESSTATAAAVQPLSVSQETPRKSFLGGLFSRSSSESKSSTA